MKVGRSAEIVALLIAVVIGLQALAGFLAVAMPYIAGVFVMVLVLRVVWFYTR